MKTLVIATDFTKTPGPRKAADGDFSAEEFRSKILKPKFEEARSKKEKLLVDLDGGFGYFDSFLEESFGGLAREYGIQPVLETLEFKSEEEPILLDKITKFIKMANSGK